jgi:hypothetical protein
VVLTALQKNPVLRYDSAAAFQADLQGLLSTSSNNTNGRPRTAPPETRFDIHSIGSTIDAQLPDSQTPMASEIVRPTSLVKTHGNRFKLTRRQVDLANLGAKSDSKLPGRWQQYRLWIVITGVLLVTMGVILSLLLLPYDAPVAPVASVPETSTFPQTTNKTDIKTEPEIVRTVIPAREPVVASPASTEQVSVPNKVESAATAPLDSADNQSVEKGTSNSQTSPNKTAKDMSNIRKTRKKVKTPVDDWKVMGHQ